MKKFSKNVKLNEVLNTIYDELLEVGAAELKRYKNEFIGELDYNIYQYGNVRVYNYDIRNLYSNYKSLKNVSDEKLIDIYKRQIRYITNYILESEEE